MNRKQLLTRPIPDMTASRATKQTYRQYPLLVAARNDEPLVAIADYGLAGQSYYSRHNAATKTSLIGDAPILVRRTLAERLAAINHALQTSPEITELFGGRVELFIEEGLRSNSVQQALYEHIFPELIQKQYPSWNPQKVAARRDKLVAAPGDRRSPAPHATGAAIDVTLRYAEANQEFAKGAKIVFSRKSADMSDHTWPDYFEHIPQPNEEDKALRRNRRIFYWVMRGALQDDDQGLEVNPTEYWHWSFGDQLWAQLRQAPCAFFGLPAES
jgi:zinc D-Ala-D-Ala dipeptidase